jgi:hypothetical protein
MHHAYGAFSPPFLIIRLGNGSSPIIPLSSEGRRISGSGADHPLIPLKMTATARNRTTQRKMEIAIAIPFHISFFFPV